jgi:hypothetical protein
LKNEKIDLDKKLRPVLHANSFTDTQGTLPFLNLWTDRFPEIERVIIPKYRVMRYILSPQPK